VKLLLEVHAGKAGKAEDLARPARDSAAAGNPGNGPQAGKDPQALGSKYPAREGGVQVFDQKTKDLAP